MNIIKVVIDWEASGIAGKTKCHELRIDVRLLRVSATENDELSTVTVPFSDEQVLTRKVAIVVEAVSLTAPEIKLGAREYGDRKVRGVALTLAQEVPVLGKELSVRSVFMVIVVSSDRHDSGRVDIHDSFKHLAIKLCVVTSGGRATAAASRGPRATSGSRIFNDVNLVGVWAEEAAGDFGDVIRGQNLPELEELLHPVGVLFSVENSNALRVRTDLDIQAVKVDH
jgi:hypothetical protein